jgi:alkyl sulfatase BDS1-like metallo-beta-lactamase superfamily hydrolase
VPAHLDQLPPAERAARYVAAMGGAAKVLAAARKAMAAGDYRWSSDLLNQLVFAEPASRVARNLLADSYEQQGYQAESAIWRNQFLFAARELREGAPGAARNSQSLDMIAAVPTQMLLDSLATRYAPELRPQRALAINLVIPDRSERVGIEAGPAVLIGRVGVPLAAPQATITAPRRMVLALLFAKLPLAQLEAAGLRVEGDRNAVAELQAALDPMPGPFKIAEP